MQKADVDGQRRQAIATGLSAGDQLQLCRFYEAKIQDYCKYFKFPFRVQATAIVYFKRFYLSRSVLDWNPKEIMYALCVCVCGCAHTRHLPFM